MPIPNDKENAAEMQRGEHSPRSRPMACRNIQQTRVWNNSSIDVSKLD
jgi:hypothetical protein